jgi:lipopolysaccharide export system protein LptA
MIGIDLRGRTRVKQIQKALMAAALAGLALAASAPAQAQISSGGGPISYSADNLQYADGERQLILTGDVDLVQGDSRIRADRLTLFFSASTSAQNDRQGLASGDIERMIAEGDVYYVRPAQSARGNRAVYDVSTDSVTFSGNVVVASDENVIRGETMVLNVNSRRTVIRPQPGERVRGVFVPRSSSGPGAASPGVSPNGTSNNQAPARN